MIFNVFTLYMFSFWGVHITLSPILVSSGCHFLLFMYFIMSSTFYRMYCGNAAPDALHQTLSPNPALINFFFNLMSFIKSYLNNHGRLQVDGQMDSPPSLWRSLHSSSWCGVMKGSSRGSPVKVQLALHARLAVKSVFDFKHFALKGV